MKKVFQILLFIAIVALAYLSYQSINKPLEFGKIQKQRQDRIIKQLKDGQIDLDTAKKNIMNVDNLQFTGINYDNVDEVIEENCHA